MPNKHITALAGIGILLILSFFAGRISTDVSNSIAMKLIPAPVQIEQGKLSDSFYQIDQTRESIVSTSSQKDFTDKNLTYSLSYPSDWYVDGGISSSVMEEDDVVICPEFLKGTSDCTGYIHINILPSKYRSLEMVRKAKINPIAGNTMIELGHISSFGGDLSSVTYIYAGSGELEDLVKKDWRDFNFPLNTLEILVEYQGRVYDFILGHFSLPEVRSVVSSFRFLP